jgi:hypothetical protein
MTWWKSELSSTILTSKSRVAANLDARCGAWRLDGRALREDVQVAVKKDPSGGYSRRTQTQHQLRLKQRTLFKRLLRIPVPLATFFLAEMLYLDFERG